MLAPVVRIALRYGVGLIAGMHVGDMLAGDPDIVLIVAAGVGAATEAVYALAKRRGWAT
ncbi:MAG: hypothetical protein M0R28_20430 [Pigmentiphaga sp.]|nr:hypothetical protein [Pigmentiphaga sp.]